MIEDADEVPLVPAMSSRRRLGRAWLLTTSTSAFVGLILFAVNPVAANILGREARGRLAAIQLVPQILADLSSVGLGFSIIHFGSARKDSLRSLIRWSIKPTAIGTAVMFVIGQLLVLPIVGGNAGDATVMRVYLLICPLTSVMILSAESLRARGDFGRWNVFVFLRGVSWPIALVVGVVGTPSISRVAYVHLGLIAVIALAAAFVIARRTRHESGIPEVTPDAHVRYGVLSAASTVPRVANAKLDQVVMSFRVSDGDFGLYSQAVGWSGITLPLMRGFTGIAMPHISEADEKQAAARVRQIVTTAAVATGALLVLGWLMTLLLWHVRYDDEFDGAFTAAMVLIPAGLLLELNAILSNVLRSLRRPGLVAVLEVVVLAVSMTCLLIVLTRSTVTGPAIVSLATYISACSLYLVYISSTLGVPTHTLFDWNVIHRLSKLRHRS